MASALPILRGPCSSALSRCALCGQHCTLGSHASAARDQTAASNHFMMVSWISELTNRSVLLTCTGLCTRVHVPLAGYGTDGVLRTVWSNALFLVNARVLLFVKTRALLFVNTRVLLFAGCGGGGDCGRWRGCPAACLQNPGCHQGVPRQPRPKGG